MQFCQIVQAHRTLFVTSTHLHAIVDHLGRCPQIDYVESEGAMINAKWTNNSNSSLFRLYSPIKSAWIWILELMYSYHSCMILYIPSCKVPLLSMHSTKQLLQIRKLIQYMDDWISIAMNSCIYRALNSDRSISLIRFSVVAVCVCSIVNVTYVWNGIAHLPGSLYIKSCINWMKLKIKRPKRKIKSGNDVTNINMTQYTRCSKMRLLWLHCSLYSNLPIN